jgi:hypothetical protein
VAGKQEDGATVTTAWLKQNVGEPSGKWGSTYSEIYSLTAKYEGKKSKDTLDKLYKKVQSWSYSSHSAAESSAAIAEKDRQQRALNLFYSAIKLEFIDKNANWKEFLQLRLKKDQANYDKEKKVVEKVVVEMRKSSTPLLRHTGNGIDDRKIVMVMDETANGAFASDGTLQINPTLTYNKSLLMGVLVHEYHHKLCHHNGNYTYLDEFVAHWKQWTIVKPAAPEEERVRQANARLKQLYASQVERWEQSGNRLVERLSDVGDFLIPDNAAAKPMERCEHSCRKPWVRNLSSAKTQ